MHEKTVEAAEFLVDHAWDVPRGDWHGAAGARALATHAPPDYERWPRVLDALDMAPRPSGTWMPVSPIDEFFAETASNADNPVLRAAAQYHLAAGLMREAKRSTMSSSEQDHAARRERALEQAKGLSVGVEDETFDDSMGRWSDEMPRTFAQAEADLIASIEHATVGSTLPEWTGRIGGGLWGYIQDDHFDFGPNTMPRGVAAVESTRSRRACCRTSTAPLHSARRCSVGTGRFGRAAVTASAAGLSLR